VVVDVGDVNTMSSRVLSVNRVNGNRTVLLGEDDRAGSGARFVTPFDIAVQANGTLWVLDPQLDEQERPTNPTVVRVDPVTGARFQVSSNANSDDVFFGSPVALAVRGNSTLWVLDTNALNVVGNFLGPVVLRVDMSTGDRTVVAANGFNDAMSNVFFGFPVDFAADANGILWVLDTNATTLNAFGQRVALGPTVIGLDPSTGARRVITANGLGTAAFGTPRGIAVDATSSVVWVADASVNLGGFITPAVWRVDPGTGFSTTISSNGPGTAFFGSLLDITVEPSTNSLLVLDAGATDLFGLRSPAVWRVDRFTGIRSLIASNRFLQNSFFAAPIGLEADDLSTRLVMVDRSLQAVVAVELGAGASSIVSK
jgi:sugar lactone lactonase YvrE